MYLLQLRVLCHGKHIETRIIAGGVSVRIGESADAAALIFPSPRPGHLPASSLPMSFPLFEYKRVPGSQEQAYFLILRDGMGGRVQRQAGSKNTDIKEALDAIRGDRRTPNNTIELHLGKEALGWLEPMEGFGLKVEFSFVPDSSATA